MRPVQIITIGPLSNETTPLDALCEACAEVCAVLPNLLGQVWRANPCALSVSGILRWRDDLAASHGGPLACSAILRHSPCNLPMHSRVYTETVRESGPSEPSAPQRPKGLVDYPEGYDHRG